MLDATSLVTGERMWRVCDLNREYRFSPTYPSVLVFPERTRDTDLAAIGAFRSKARVPALSWLHPVNRASLWRSSQPKIGLGNNSCAADENLLATIRAITNPGQPLLIADARPRANAMVRMSARALRVRRGVRGCLLCACFAYRPRPVQAQRAGGFGYETYPGTDIMFLGIHNIHAVRDSFKKVQALALGLTKNDVTWDSNIADSSWTTHVRTILQGGMTVAHALHVRGIPVLVHCRCAAWRQS